MRTKRPKPLPSLPTTRSAECDPGGGLVNRFARPDGPDVQGLDYLAREPTDSGQTSVIIHLEWRLATEE